MSTDPSIRDSIERAAESVASTWPLHSFVTVNPLSGFEDRPFREAIREGERLFGGRGYPSADVFRRAFEAGRIDPEVLSRLLVEHGYSEEPEALLDRMAATESVTEAGRDPSKARVERVLTKWLAAFLDQGQTDWPMPNREQGFYAAFRAVARFDRRIPDRSAMTGLPEDPVDAIAEVLAGRSADRFEAVFEYHLTALPGWTGLIKHRTEAAGEWQSEYPITLAGYLAIRLVLTDLFDAPIAPPEDPRGTTDHGDTADAADDATVPLPAVWLDAWEATYRDELVSAVTEAGRAGSTHPTMDGDGRPAAQLVFCIDTRSEVIRRHVEQAGPYETHGYAGFFGVPMRYDGYDREVPIDACPPILDVQHRIADRPLAGRGEHRASYDRWTRLRRVGRDLLHTLKTNPGTAFSFVESAGSGYGLALAVRTLLPARVYDARSAAAVRVPEVHEFCTPTVAHDPEAGGDLPVGLTLDERVEYAANAFALMGWEEFARVVAFVGHAGQTANNPFDSSLDCGACAGNPGGPNARVLAAICNDEAVRERLRDRGIDIPADTVFLAGEHNTTTDEVTLYTGDVPASHAADVERLRADLESARAGAAAERAAAVGVDPGTGVRETERRAADWAETRPEWGLAGNAAFVIGPRELTADLNLDGRSFLHSYDPATDPDGEALEAIMTGPMVVTQWINSQYYFASVDNAVYGSGSKVTQNPVGNVGVYQGNGGDLRTGLPLQSLNATDDERYHQPLRLSVVIDAPVGRVTAVLKRHDHLTDLLDNGWLAMTVIDPQRDYDAFHYDGELTWTSGPSGGGTGSDVRASSQPGADGR